MKRALAIGFVVLAGIVVLVLGTGASGNDGQTYRVRAIFDNAGFLVTGEDVKIAGVKVGVVESLDVTPDRKAAVVLRIDDGAFQDFKQDASCAIRLQSLIGEKFVACQPTQPHDANAQPQPSLHKIDRGPGKGDFLLPVANTSSPVDVDLLNDIMRLPQRQRLGIIINELGVGLAGNGQQLRAVVRRADPALAQFDRVLKILADQNRTLANLASEGDAALAPIARQSSRVSDFVDKAGQTATATAERGDALEANFAKLPTFLTQLRPTVRRLGEFAGAATPVFANLRAAAPSINRLFEQLGPFSTAARPTFRTLGTLSDVGRAALPASQPVIRDIAALGSATKPLAANLAAALTSLQGQHGIERLLDVILFTTGSTNGFNAVSHYLRTALVVPIQCLSYATRENFNQCGATFSSRVPPAATSASAAVLNAGSTVAAAVSTSAPGGVPPATTSATPSAAKRTGSRSIATSGLLGYLLGSGDGR